MGFLDDLFSKDEPSNEELEKRKYEKLIRDLKNNQDINSYKRDEILDFIKNNVLSDGELIDMQFNFDDFSFLLSLYRSASTELLFNSFMGCAKDIYEKVVIDKNDRKQRQYFFKILRIAFQDDFDFVGELVTDYSYIFDIFEKKELFLSFLENVQSKIDYDIMEDYLKYVTLARRYYIDEVQFLVRVITVANDYYYEDFCDSDIEALLKEDMRNAGIYDISRADIEEIEDRFSELKKMLEDFTVKSERTVAKIGEEVSSLDGVFTRKVEEKTGELNQLIDRYSNEITTGKDDAKNYFDSLTTSMKELKTELDKAMANLVRGETLRITDDYQKCVNLINELIKNSADMDVSYYESIRELGEILKRLVSIINEKEVKISGETPLVSGESKYFDSSIPLKDRLNEVLKNKKSGEIYHSSIDKVVKEILNNNAVYLVGPSGSCKTYSVKQVAELLKLPLYDFGFVTDEHETFKSYKDVNGRFVENIFYNAYKTGGICFFDEIDNSESKALVELNRIIGGNGEYEPYLFPNGELVYPHPNLRIIVAGNTFGDGANEAYSTRERLDFGTIDRFQAIEFYYDEELEKKVLKDYPDIYEFCMAYRAALSRASYEYSFTTRRIFKIKKNLDSGCYTPEEIVQDFFVNNLRIDVLETIKKNIELTGNNEYENIFAQIVDGKKNKIHTKNLRRGR